MKKRIFLAAILGVALSAAAFADHPGGWGIGLMGNYGFSYLGVGNAGATLSLKVPGVPVFWGISLGFDTYSLTFGLRGDYYLFDQALVPAIKLGWYLGVGGFFDFWTYSSPYSYWSNYSHSALDFGVRLPIGLSWQPLNFLEFFLEIAPSIGLFWDLGTSYAGYSDSGRMDLYLFFPGAIGFRFWF